MSLYMSEEALAAQTTLNNIENNNYTVADYKMCEKEATIVIKALEKYLNGLALRDHFEQGENQHLVDINGK